MEAKTTARPAVLVLDGNAENLDWTSDIVRGVEASASSAASIDDPDALAAYDLIVADYDGLHGRDRRMLFDAIDRAGGGRPHVLILSSAPAGSETLFRELEPHQLTNVLAVDRHTSEKELSVTARKLLDGVDIFGIDKYFGAEVERLAIKLRNSAEISGAVDSATRFATDLSVHPRLIENAATVVDELATNALYNAPVDARGNPRFAHLPRTTPVELEAGEHVALTLCSDGESFGIAVADSFGALTREQSLGYVVKCIRGHEEKPTRDKGGAGLGLYMTFDALNHMVVNIRRGRQTEVIGMIDIRGSFRDFVNRGKSLNFFLSDPDRP